MKESQEITDYLEIDFTEKRLFGSQIRLTKEDFTVVFTAIGGQIRVDFVPPKSHYNDS